MTDIPDRSLPEGLWEWIGYYHAHHPDRQPAQIILARDVYHHVLYGQNAHGMRHDHFTHLIGVPTTVDDRIEPGTWQVLAADGALLRDSRSGTKGAPPNVSPG